MRAGEILGIGGLAGAGRSELARSLVGIDPCDDGEITLDGEHWFMPDNLRASMRRGLAYLTEDRKLEGLALLNTAQREHAVGAERAAVETCPGPRGLEIFDRFAQ